MWMRARFDILLSELILIFLADYDLERIGKLLADLLKLTGIP